MLHAELQTCSYLSPANVMRKSKLAPKSFIQ